MTIVQDLLTLARRGVAVKQVINLNTLVHEYLQSAEHHNMQAFHPGVIIETDLYPSLPNIVGSAVHLSKTLMNLVCNAAEAIEVTGTVVISTHNRPVGSGTPDTGPLENDYVQLIVKDTGHGIASEDLDKIFEPFFTKKVMGRSGTGLGMAVVWGTIQDHGGQIDVQSVLGEGSVFTLSLPATKEKSLPEKASHSVEAVMGCGEKILVVDDLEDQREIATHILERLGYVVDSVDSGEAAIEFLKEQSVDLILLDMIMRPGMDGLEAYRKISALHPGQKAVIASGFSESQRVKEAQRLGAGPYIRKPYTIEGLGAAVRAELDGSQRRYALSG